MSLKISFCISLLIIVSFFSCKEKTPEKSIVSSAPQIDHKSDIHVSKDYDQSEWKELTTSMGFILDIKYATMHNFTKEAVYECARCFLRPSLADTLIEINRKIKPYGLSIKLFDCYRPLAVQKRLWDHTPNPIYVTPPEKGSMHNRGLAVDLSLVDKHGVELDMGTAYDHFGKESHPSFLGLEKEVLRNRNTLFDLMLSHGLKGINSEWWHYSLQTEKASISNWQWVCD